MLGVLEQELLTPPFVEQVLAAVLTRVPTVADVDVVRDRITGQLNHL